MGQGEVIKFLEKQNKPMTRGEIAKGMGECPIKTSTLIRKLIKKKEILFKEIDRIEAFEYHKCYRRCKVYFL